MKQAPMTNGFGSDVESLKSHTDRVVLGDDRGRVKGAAALELEGRPISEVADMM